MLVGLGNAVFWCVWACMAGERNKSCYAEAQWAHRILPVLKLH